MHSLLRSARLSKGSGFRALLEAESEAVRHVSSADTRIPVRPWPAGLSGGERSRRPPAQQNRASNRRHSPDRRRHCASPDETPASRWKESASGGRKRQEVASPRASRRHASRHRCCAFSECKDPSRIGLSSVSPSVLASPVFLLNL